MRYISVKTQDTRHETQDIGRGSLKSKVLSLESLIAVLSILLLIVFPARAGEEVSDETKEVVGLFGTLLVPSIFTSAGTEKLGVSLYGRTLTGEGEVPDFESRDVKEEINGLAIFASGRMSGFGLTVGLGPGGDLEFSQPFVLSLDYKKGFLGKTPIVDAAADVQYSMIVLPNEEKIKVSALGFGVLSINGMVSANLLMLEPYVGVTLNYVYLSPGEKDFIGVWKIVPKLGLQYTVLPLIAVAAEIKIIRNEHLNSAWMWDMGITARF